MTDCTFIHGWGCSRDLWPPANGYFFDRGYYKQPQPIIFSKKLVTHSFGLHFVPIHYFKQLEELIILSGFITFVTKRRVIEQMLKRFEGEPSQVLRDFLGDGVPAEIDKNLLKEDLKQLSIKIFDTKVIKNVPTVKIIHGRVDPITPFKWGEELHEQIPQSQFFPIEGGHFDSIQAAHRLGFF